MFVWFENSDVIINAEDVSRAYLVGERSIFVMKDGKQVVIEDKEDTERFKAYVLDEGVFIRPVLWDATLGEGLAAMDAEDEGGEAPFCVCTECLAEPGLDVTDEGCEAARKATRNELAALLHQYEYYAHRKIKEQKEGIRTAWKDAADERLDEILDLALTR